jgi:hypothetical protein
VGRIDVLETSDLSWFPTVLRDFETDLLQLFITTSGIYDAAAPLLERCLERTGASEITDLCSGAGGPWSRLQPMLARRLGRDVRVTLTDLRPNEPALERVAARSGGSIGFRREPLDATAVGAGSGVRTLFTAFHHLSPGVARRVLEDARDAGAAIGVFEFNARSPGSLLTMLASPLAVLATTPFVRPLRLARFLLTYLVPIVPLNVLWNGFASSLRTYGPRELADLTADLGAPGYTWEVGSTARTWPRPRITYLLGMPAPRAGAAR